MQIKLCVLKAVRFVLQYDGSYCHLHDRHFPLKLQSSWAQQFTLNKLHVERLSMTVTQLAQ